jgi:nitrogen regulatory protein PII
MTDNSGHKLEALITILDVELENTFLDICEDTGVPVALLTYGHGSVKSRIYEMLGYGGPKKTVAISINTDSISQVIMAKMHREIDLSRPGTGISFTVKLSSISKMLSKVCLGTNEMEKIGSENMVTASKEPYNLIIAIVNSGHFDQVMDAAKAAGASGGTLIHARSVGSREAIKYLGITVQPEKDLVLILTKQEKKLPIMKNIIAEAGLSTPAAGCCFSLPVSDVLGTDAVIENFNKL